MNTEEFLYKFEDLLDACSELQVDKSNDYATDDNPFLAFENSRMAGITPEQAIFSRMLDKVSRLSNIIQNKEMNVAESSRDTIMDLINYSAILQVYLESKSE